MSGPNNEDIYYWYAAHVLLYVEFLDNIQDYYLVWENICLIKASSVAQAYEKADKLGLEQEEFDKDSGHTLNGRPVRFHFAGIRRLAECIDFDDGPEDGKEVTYLEYSFKDKATLDALLERREAVVVMEAK